MVGSSSGSRRASGQIGFFSHGIQANGGSYGSKVPGAVVTDEGAESQ